MLLVGGISAKRIRNTVQKNSVQSKILPKVVFDS